MESKNMQDSDQMWADWFSGNAFVVEKRQRHMLHFLPHNPRCKFCNAPFEGAGGALVRVLYGRRRSLLNPKFCNVCEEFARRFPGGHEVDMSMLFVDIRGSTALSETMSPRDFSQLINRFYKVTTSIISAEDGLVEKLAGDEVAAFWGAGFAGADYVGRTVKVAREIVRELEKQSIPAGIGVHAGRAFFGALGTPDGMTNITAIGDEVNLAARLASKAARGEIILSEAAIQAAGVDASTLENRTLELKGIAGPVSVRVMAGPSLTTI